MKKYILDKISILEFFIAKLVFSKRKKYIAKSDVAFILPADPNLITGSKGDEAMLVAIYNNLTSRGFKKIYVHAGVASVWDPGDLDIIVHRGWGKGFGLMKSIASILKFQPKEVVAIGADMIDGHYFLPHSIRTLGVLYCFKSMGAEVKITGFSFNSKPRLEITKVIKQVASQVTLNCRDPISFERVSAFTNGKNTRLTADCAFLLEKKIGERYSKLKEWIESDHCTGNVIGFNVHGMLNRGASRDGDSLVENSISIVKQIIEQGHKVVLIAHDNRGKVGDESILEAISKSFSKNDVFFSDANISAAEIKGVATLLDGLITGRMHLAIAGLGVGVPCMVLAYQGKFEGLFKHFDLPNDLVLSEKEYLSMPCFSMSVNSFLASLDSLKAHIKLRQSDVREKALKNFDSCVE